MRKRRAPSRTAHNVSVRLSDDEMAVLVRWTEEDPHERGMGHQLRRLINEEVVRERDRHQAANRAG